MASKRLPIECDVCGARFRDNTALGGHRGGRNGQCDLPHDTARERTTNSVPIGIQIMEHRKKAGLTQNFLAIRVGCHPSALSRIEKGDREPAFHLAESLLEACGARLIVTRTLGG